MPVGATDPLDEAVAFSRCSGLALEHLHLTALTSHGWRVSDGRLPLDDPMRVLAFIEIRDGRIEVMQLGCGFRWDVFPTMREALEHVVRTTPAVTMERLGGTAV